MERITVFNAEKTNLKLPISPFGDKTFIFATVESNNNRQLYNMMVSNYILNIPINIPPHDPAKPFRTYRRKENLDQFYFEKITYLVLDIDYVYTEEAQQKILEYFNDYRVIIGASYSFNGVDNFRMKGLPSYFTWQLEP